MKSYLVIFEKTKTGFSAFVPDLPGCIATGKTRLIAEKNIYQAIQMHLEALKSDKQTIPPANTEALTFCFSI